MTAPRRVGQLAEVMAPLLHPRWREEILADLVEEAEERAARGASSWVVSLRFAGAVLGAAAASRWQAARDDHGDREGWMEGTLQDIRFAVRGLRRSPLFSLVAFLTLGAGIGLTLAVVTVAHGVLVRPLDYPEPDRLVLLQGQPGARFGVSMPQHIRFREATDVLESAAAWQGWSPVAPDASGSPVRHRGASVSWNYFNTVGVAPAAGRLFAPRDGAPGHEPVVVLGHDLWSGRFGADPGIVGRSVELDGVAHRVVGVTPEGFEDPVSRALGFASREMWRSDPPGFREDEERPGQISYWSIGRLRPGAQPDALTADMRRAIVETWPGPEIERYASEFRAVSIREAVVEDVRPTLLVLLFTAGVVLLIACVNLANLLLARATVRRNELAVRSSLGAGRGRLVRQLITESLVLALGGAVLGLAISYLAVPILVGMAGPALPRAEAVALDGWVLLYALAAAVATALFFGVVPAFRAGGSAGLRDAIEGRRGAMGSHGGGLRRGLVVGETALAMVLLTGAGLFALTFLRLQAVDVGFEPERVLTMQLGLGQERFPEPSIQTAALLRVEDAVRSLPGVTAVGSVTDAPLSGAVNSTRIRRSDETDEAAAERENVLVRAVTPGWFDAMGISYMSGGMDAAEPGGPDVAVVNEEFVRRFYPEVEARGRSVVVRGVERTIVGVVPSMREFDLTSPELDPVLYTPYAQEDQPWMRSGVTLTVRTGGRPEEVAPRLRTTVLTAEPSILAGTVRPLDALVEAQLRVPRFRATLVLVFAGLAVLLAAVGVGGVVAYGVSQRIPEIGLRMALGAARGQVRAMMLRETAVMVGAGVALGAIGALVGGRVLQAFLFQIEPGEPRILAGAAALLFVAGLAASWIPARRAARVDPATTLRSS